MKRFLTKFLLVVLIKVVVAMAEMINDMFGQHPNHTHAAA
jgi:hypothetical protein